MKGYVLRINAHTRMEDGRLKRHLYAPVIISHKTYAEALAKAEKWVAPIRDGRSDWVDFSYELEEYSSIGE